MIISANLWLALAMLLVACGRNVEIGGQIDEPAPIWPDYQGVTIPCNIAPLNFTVTDPGTYTVLAGAHAFHADADGNINFPLKAWRKLTDRADSITFTLCKKDGDKWLAYKPFTMHISPDSIDSHLAYRLLPPLYGTWNRMGIYQRNLENFDEEAIFDNYFCHGNCGNCHSFCARDPQQMLFHMRGKGGATYMLCGNDHLRLETKTDSTISKFTYPYWHPSGKFVAFSVNDIFQVFHTSDPNRTEVCDDDSDVIIYDIEHNEVVYSPLFKNKDCLETFPAFSPSGTRMYFCTAPMPEKMPECYKDVRYSLCAIDFDPATRKFGATVDTLYNAQAMGGSISFPRPSPDGRWLVATLSDYGNFSIWHKTADLWLLDLQSGSWAPLTAANSPDVESYHSWSGNSRWMVLSSRRDDGLYTRPYFTHIDSLGRASKPFILPQKSPKQYYADQMNSYNIPELVDGHVSLTPRQVADWTSEPLLQVK